MTAWQPMETAPKDGSWILAYAPKAPNGYGVIRVDYWSKKHEAWMHSNQAEWPNTHWMPLPAPPPISGAGQNEEAGK